jgi:hypothetical protein
MPLTIYHNNRNGTFTDVSRTSGLDRFVGRALGVVAVDFDDDGWPDLFIARDADPNLLLYNKHDGTFADAGLEAEIAYDRNGNARAGMGVDVGDINSDGRPDVVVTNFNFEFHSLFLNRAEFPFEDWTRASGLAGPTRSDVGWGAHFLDYDNDGLPDVFITAVGGNHLFHNEGGGKFKQVTQESGVGGTPEGWSTSAAWIDYDNDGKLDLFVCNYIRWSPELDHAAPLSCPTSGERTARPAILKAFSPVYTTTTARVISPTFPPPPASRCAIRRPAVPSQSPWPSPR